MPDSFTPNLNLVLPEVGGSASTWGNKLNSNFGILDTAIHDRVKQSDVGPGQLVGRLGTGNVIGLTAAQARSLIFLTKVVATVGDGTSTSIVVDHFLGTRDVFVQLYQAGPPHGSVSAEIVRTTLNSITLNFSTAPAAASVRVLITTG